MLKLPEKINQPFQQFLINKGLADKHRYFYSKWLRFYWDFCHKYHHPTFYQNSRSQFLAKLKDKGPSESQREQASKAITFLYEMASILKENKTNPVRETANLPPSLDPAIGNGASIQNRDYNAPISKHEASVEVNISGSIEPPPSQLNSGASWVFVNGFGSMCFLRLDTRPIRVLRWCAVIMCRSRRYSGRLSRRCVMRS